MSINPRTRITYPSPCGCGEGEYTIEHGRVLDVSLCPSGECVVQEHVDAEFRAMLVDDAFPKKVRAKRRRPVYFDPEENTGEAWRPTHNPRYLVSDAGRVRREDTGRIIQPIVGPNGYGLVATYDGQGRRTGEMHLVHRLVAVAFCHRPEGKMHINHKNTNRMDNRAVNLEWVTPAENNAHARSVKRPAYATGSAVFTTKLTPDAVRDIRSRQGRQSVRSIALKYGVDHKTIGAIFSGRTWKEVE